MTEPISQTSQYDHIYKIVLLGDSGVGKTHLINKYIKGESNTKNLAPTIGVEFATKTITLRNGRKVKAQIWDTAGQELYRAITSAHYRNAQGAILVYDISKEKSFESIKEWLTELNQHSSSDIVILLVGNKLDLDQKNMRKVEYKDAQQFANESNILFQEASALQSLNVVDCFEQVLEEIFDKKYEVRASDTKYSYLNTDFCEEQSNNNAEIAYKDRQSYKLNYKNEQQFKESNQNNNQQQKCDCNF